MPEQLVPVAQVSVRLNRTREQVIRLIQRGSLRGTLQNGRWYADRRAVDRLARERGSGERVVVG